MDRERKEGGNDYEKIGVLISDMEIILSLVLPCRRKNKSL
jgi:hypothetical protein